MKLDAFDRKILAALQRDGALTNALLSEKVGLSASQVSRRRARLEASGAISGYHAHLDPKVTGMQVRAIVRVNLRSHSTASASEFARLVESTPQIVEAISVSGDSDYVLTVECTNLEDFAALIHETLLPHQNISQVRSELVLKALKRQYGGRPA